MQHRNNCVQMWTRIYFYALHQQKTTIPYNNNSINQNYLYNINNINSHNYNNNNHNNNNLSRAITKFWSLKNANSTILANIARMDGHNLLHLKNNIKTMDGHKDRQVGQMLFMNTASIKSCLAKWSPVQPVIFDVQFVSLET